MRKRSNFEVKKNEIRQVITGYFGVDFLQKTRKREVCFPRQIYAYCLYIFTDMKLMWIAKEAGYADHSNTLYSVSTIRGLCTQNEKIKKQVIEIESMIE